jgi:hypothetical protein
MKHFDKPGAAASAARARAEKLSPEQRTEIATKGGKARWRNTLRAVRATHVGELELGGVGIECAVLADGRRVLSERAFVQALGRARPGGQTYQRRAGDHLPIYLALRRLKPFVPDGLSVATVPYVGLGQSSLAHGIDATAIPAVCEVWLRARDAGVLQAQQLPTAQRADIIMRGLAQTGIIALVDEATGYQHERARDALAKILESFIAKELAAWAKRFPDEFYALLHKLRGLPQEASRHPMYFGHLTNDIVYQRLAPGVLEDLRQKIPIKNGRRGAKHHQWLTADMGHPKLQAHLSSVIALMKLAPDYETFIHYLDRVAPRFGNTLELPLPQLEAIAA